MPLLLLLGVVLLAGNLLATRLVARTTRYPRAEMWIRVAIIWLLPFLGALFASAAAKWIIPRPPRHRRGKRPDQDADADQDWTYWANNMPEEHPDHSAHHADHTGADVSSSSDGGH